MGQQSHNHADQEPHKGITRLSKGYMMFNSYPHSIEPTPEGARLATRNRRSPAYALLIFVILFLL